METPKSQALQFISQLADDSSWQDIIDGLQKKKNVHSQPSEDVDWDKFIRRVKTVLNDEFPEAEALTFEMSDDGQRINGYVVSKDFQGMEDADRQDRVWDVLENNLAVAEQSRILSVIALTPEEGREQEVS